MKRFMTAFVAGVGMMLATTAGVATAGLVPLPPSHPAPTQQSNDSDQGQVQVIPIAPQINLQNVNVLSGGVSQGNVNNANTGQAAQQENGGQSAPVSNGTSKSDGGSSQAAGRNDSDQGQVQVIPIAPQVNGQNVNVLSGGVSQGNANNANTGQAAQQENGGQSVPAPRLAEKGNGGGGPSQAGGSNDSDQGQVQVIPIAPQLNGQNVNVLSGGVSQGNVNNANTGQAAQQENGGQSAPVSNSTFKSDSGSSQAAGRNDSDQGQVQIIPIAPQVNLQNVNVASVAVEQGDANNANTGQAAQQENGGQSVPAPRLAEKGNGGGGHSQAGGSNDSDQGQVQVIPIAPQLNGQNVNVLSGGVSQGNANNANTGQAAQQENGGQSAPVLHVVKKGDSGSSQAAGRNDSDQGQVQIVPIAPQVNLQNVNVASVAVEQGDANNANTGQAAQQENGGQSAPVIYGVTKGDGGHSQAGGSNDSDQGQIQIIPIAPQLNGQNVNVLSGGVSQGNANNANTGQAAQQENGGQSAPVLHVVKKGDSGSSQAAGRNDSDQGQVQIVPIAPQVNLQNVNVASVAVEQGDANNANTGQAAQQENGGQSAPVIYGVTKGDGGHSQAGGSNDSDQGQIQIIPIAPQLNGQNVNVLSGGVSQGNANNANTGQAAQQQGETSGEPGGNGPKPCYDRCEPKPEPCYQRCEPKPEPCYQRCEPKPEPCYQRCEPKPEPCYQRCEPKPEPCYQRCEPKPEPCYQRCEPKPEPKPCPPKHEQKPCPPKHEPKPCPPKHEPKPCPPKEEPRPCPPPKHEDRTTGSRNNSDQHQVQIVPIAPQLNLQNVNLLSGGVTQGNANNANTGQAAQQSNGSGLPKLPVLIGGGLPTIG